MGILNRDVLREKEKHRENKKDRAGWREGGREEKEEKKKNNPLSSGGLDLSQASFTPLVQLPVTHTW